MKNFFLRQLPLLGEKGQEKLAKSVVGIVGVGGLGSVVADLLVRSGIGKILLIDKDFVRSENIHRQLLYTYHDLNKPKVLAAKEKLQAVYPDGSVEIFQTFLTKKNATDLLASCHVIVDCTDRIRARYILNDVSEKLNIPWVFGALLKYSFQLSVFNLQGKYNYKCLFPEEISEEEIPTCNTEGILPPTVYAAASLQANEVLKILLGETENLLNGKLLLGNLLENRYEVLEISPCSRTNETFFVENKISEGFIAYSELLQWLKENKDFLLWDLRFPWEEEECQISGEKTDLGELKEKLRLLSKDRTLVFFCNRGIRSRLAMQTAKSEGFFNSFFSYCPKFQ